MVRAELKTELDDTELARTVEALVTAFAPDRVYLFGSRARGEANEDSDYDLMVVVPSSDETKADRMRRAARAIPYQGVPVDVLVWTAEEFFSRLTLRASLPATVERDGRLLYRAG